MLKNLKRRGTSSKLYTNVTNIQARQFLEQKGKNLKKASQQTSDFNDDEEDYYIDVDVDGLETVMDHLLTAILDSDTVVRWDAAKGIGRITARLNLEMADDIIEEIIESLQSEPNNVHFWHGA